DFARLDPVGALGRKLVTRVEEVMLQDNLPVLRDGASMRDAIVTIAERRGIAVRVDGDGRVDGVLTAGDLSRLVEREGDDLLKVPLEQVMTRSAKTARVGELASAVVYRLEQHGIMVMPVVDGGERLGGVVH